MRKGQVVFLVVLIVLILDQALKIWVKTNMEYGSEFKILGFNWAYIHFVENNGMAFGIQFGGSTGKLLLSLFRIAAVAFLIYYLNKLIKAGYSTGLLICFALILAGAIGNIIDSTIYGVIFSESRYHGGVATVFPEGGGYARLLYGRVVDMLYFPLVDTTWPDWIPGIGGNRFQFFKPVFNIADTAISTGIISMIVFHRNFFKADPSGKQKVAQTNSATSVEEE